MNNNNETRIEGIKKVEAPRAYMYSNPVERERMYIEKAQRDQIAREARFSLAGIFGGKRNQ